MIKIDLSGEEKQILHHHFKTTPLILIRLKSQAILMKNKDISTVDIADVLGRDERSVKRWLSDFRKRRLSSIFTGHKGNGNASKLTKAQREEIGTVLSHKPSEFGIPKEFWDVPKLKDYVLANFGVIYESDRSYHFLLEFGNLSFKVPDKFRVERNETLIKARMKEVYQEIEPYLSDSNWEVFCSDETRLMFQAVIRRAWLQKGAKTVVKVENKDEHQNYLGFLNQKTFKCHVLPIAYGRAKEIVKATTKFLKLYPGKRIVIVWDNATHHKGKLFIKALQRGGPLQRVHLIALPPYAPDVNPIEHIWDFAKDKLANHQDQDFGVTRKKFMRLTNNQIFHYQL